jgi:polyprenyl-phospho-N-acetylgalactosaminyl synthase
MTSVPPRVFVLVRAYNEEPVIGEVLDGVTAFWPPEQVVVVDDGSSDRSADVAASRGVRVVRHAVNLGAGAALATGFAYVLERSAEAVVVFDADGQMFPEDIPRVLEPVLHGECDVAVGTRFAGVQPEGLWWLRRVVLRAAAVFTRLTVRLPLSDPHNGFRAFSRKAVEAIRLSQDRFAYASEIAQEIARLGLRWREVPVRIAYTEHSRRKGQSSLGALDIIGDLFWRPKR